MTAPKTIWMFAPIDDTEPVGRFASTDDARKYIETEYGTVEFDPKHYGFDVWADFGGFDECVGKLINVTDLPVTKTRAADLHGIPDIK